jgi:hypothetical protein
MGVSNASKIWKNEAKRAKWDVSNASKIWKNEAKRAKSLIFRRLKALQDKGFSEIWS